MRKIKRDRAALAAAIVASLFFLHGAFSLFVPAGGKSLKLVEIPPGSSVRQIARLLKASGIIRNEFYFVALSRVARLSLKAGEYGFRRASMLSVLSAVSKGRVYLHRILVREGDSAAQIADMLEKENLVAASSFLEAVSNRDLLSRLDLKGNSAEGFLFPDTYMLSKGIAAEKAVLIMVERFREKVPAELEKAAARKGFSRRGWVTLASIVEKEARVPDERKVIAGVFANRLKRGMRLQADPTVLYALGRWDQNLTYDDLLVKNPYNTYRYAGLPPGPICNPGLACLEAAANPAKVSYLYFVTRKDGTGRHDFSTTLEAHERAIRISREREKKQEVQGK